MVHVVREALVVREDPVVHATPVAHATLVAHVVRDVVPWGRHDEDSPQDEGRRRAGVDQQGVGLGAPENNSALIKY